MPIHQPINLIQHRYLAIQLIPNLNRQFPLPSDTLAQPIELLILRRENFTVVRVDLLVIELTLVRRGIDGVIAVGKQLRARRILGFCGGRAGSVGETYGFGRGGGCGGGAAEGFLEERGGGAALGARGGGVGEVGGEGRVVGVGEGGGAGGEAVELRG
jgi:hypothetical protein